MDQGQTHHLIGLVPENMNTDLTLSPEAETMLPKRCLEETKV